MTRERFSRWHLERLGIDSFGKLSDFSLGPLRPGMNVVYGKNESGKTTLSSFISGVLFGWSDGRSRQNTYRPANAERSGRLLFSDGAGGEAVLERVRNVEGVEDAEGLLDDIDAATYQTVFALDSDELLALDDTNEVTSHLLTAGSGTDVSPVRALAELDKRIASYTSRAAGATHSLVNLSARLDDVNAQLAAAEAEAEALLAESRELEELELARAVVAREHDELNALIEGRSADLSLVQKLNNQLVELEAQQGELSAQLEQIREEERLQSGRPAAGVRDAELMELRNLTASEERSIRDTIEDLQTERDRLSNAADFAKRNYADSSAAYEVLEETVQAGDVGDARSKAAGQVVMSIILPAIALLAGIPTVIYGRQIASLSITAFGVFLVLVALVMGAAAIVMMLRPDHSGTTLEQRLEDATWVMRQDEKKLAACERELQELNEQIASYLRFNHLEAAGGSLRRARSLLDEARDLRMAVTVFDQRRQEISAQMAVLEGSIQAARTQRDELLDDAGVAETTAFEALLAEASERRRELIERSEKMDTRYGELVQRLSQARDATRFSELKQERASLRVRLEEGKRDYACLLLARRNLADSIATWEAASQPQVYRLASRLFEDMTGGAWQQVRLGADGEVRVLNADGEQREPLLLSLGTRQQLYLALRIALLLTAGNVGQAVPVLADDILVNFDADRRRSAARALLELAECRQVLLFTCHEEVVSLLQDLAPTVNTLEL